MTRPARSRLARWLPAIGALAGAMGGVAIVAATPPVALVDSARLLGLDAVPDHAVLVPVAAFVVGSVCWATCYLLWGPGGPLATMRRRPARPARRLGHQPMPQRRARPQWPVAAVDIPAPTPRARPLPADLDQPLSAFDPNSIPLVSFESIRRQGLRPDR